MPSPGIIAAYRRRLSESAARERRCRKATMVRDYLFPPYGRLQRAKPAFDYFIQPIVAARRSSSAGATVGGAMRAANWAGLRRMARAPRVTSWFCIAGSSELLAIVILSFDFEGDTLLRTHYH
jgi:hypothetical protein